MRADSPENVSDLIAKPAEKYDPEPRYISKYRDEIRRDSKRGKSAHKTFGVPSVALNPPDQFLKKRSSSAPKRPSINHEHYRRPGYQRKLPDWKPIKVSEINEQLIENLVDFTKKNIERAKNLRPSKVRKYYVDDRHGNSQSLKQSGLFPFYRNRKSYGQVPGNVSPREENRHRSENPRKENGKSEKHEKPTRKKSPSPRRRENKKFEEKNSGKDKKRHEDKFVEEKRENDKRRNSKSPKKKNGDVQRENRDGRKDSKSVKNKNGHEKHENNDGRKKSQSLEIEDENEEEIGSSEDQSERESSMSSIVDSSRIEQPRCRYVTEDERAELLYGMKKKWDEMMKQFQCLPFLTDTPPKAKRKSKMEKDLLQLEKDIEVIERHPYIYVYSDED